MGALTWVSANELWPGALLGRRGIGGADQLVLGHLGVGLGELQPQSLGDLWIKPDPLPSNGERSQQENEFPIKGSVRLYETVARYLVIWL